MAGMRYWQGLVEAQRARADEAIRQRDELRAVLAPLLEKNGLPAYYEECCQFCGMEQWAGQDRHEFDCPAKPANRDRLLGRDRAPAAGDAS